MIKNRILTILLAFVVIILANGCGPQSTTKRFDATEATIANIHDAFQSGDLSCRQLVEIYFERIDAYDQPTKLMQLL